MTDTNLPNSNDITDGFKLAFNEAVKPALLLDDPDTRTARLVYPPDWKIQEIDQETLLDHPRRKAGYYKLHDTASFIAYVQRNLDPETTTLWADIDLDKSSCQIVAVFDDHGPALAPANWKSHRAVFSPIPAYEWVKWTLRNKANFTQRDFAVWIEDNGSHIAGGNDKPELKNYPSGADMLGMATKMEINMDKKFKSQIRLQSGGVELAYVDNEDAGTLNRMKVFERFALGIPVFRNDSPYMVEARLRYRVKDGFLTFFYELIRPDRIFDTAVKEILTAISDKTGLTCFMGTP